MAHQPQEATAPPQPQQKKLPTPSTSHLDFATIYEPAEDSFLFLDTLSSTTESTFLHNRFSRHRHDNGDGDDNTRGGLLVVEVGTGSGVILAFATAHAERIFGRQDVLTLGIDVNRDACRGAAETVRRATARDPSATSIPTGSGAGTGDGGVNLGIVQADLGSALRRNCADVLLFNPPYVPTESVPAALLDQTAARFERESQLLALSYAGGEDGMEVTERLLTEVPEVLSTRGVAYVLFCARNKADQALKRIMAGDNWRHGQGRSQWEWAVEVVGKTGGKGGWERLEIWRIWRRFSS